MSDQPNSGRYTAMKYQRCGRSGLLLPRISLGLWQNFGDTDDFGKYRSTLLRAFDLGITHFDLANNYGPPRVPPKEISVKSYTRISPRIAMN